MQQLAFIGCPMLTYSTFADKYCHGVEFKVTDDNQLAKAIALILTKEFGMARQLFGGTPDTSGVGFSQREIDDIIERRLKPTDLNHRDGLIFQMMMWLAASLDLEPGDYVSQPHAQAAFKGQDLIIVHMKDDAVVAMTICEDKATKNPRHVITSEVWPEIKEYEAGGRIDELRSAIIYVLGAAQIPPEKAQSLTRKISWEGRRRYRVRVTVENARPPILFKGFSDLVTGGKDMCRGEVALLPDMRAWMSSLATKVEAELQSFVEASVV